MIDLDGFKAINDEFGHQVGDMALRQVAAAIRQNVRHSDFCARYAGDEFVVVLPACERPEADRRALHIQRALDAWSRTARRRAPRPAISVGVAVSPEDGPPTTNCSPPPIAGCTTTRNARSGAMRRSGGRLSHWRGPFNLRGYGNLAQPAETSSNIIRSFCPFRVTSCSGKPPWVTRHFCRDRANIRDRLQ